LLAVGRLHEVDRLFADHAEDVAGSAHESNALSDQHLWVPTADWRWIDVAFVVDVLHDQPDLVDVAVEHDRRRSAGIDFCHAVAGDVCGDVDGERRRLFAPDASGSAFETRRAGRVE
jgi:hypothetical protein